MRTFSLSRFKVHSYLENLSLALYLLILFTVYQETLTSLKFGKFSISTFWRNKVWRMIQVIKAPLILIQSQLPILCTLQQIIMALMLEIYCSFIMDGFSLTIWPRFVEFIKLSLHQSFSIYSNLLFGSINSCTII